MATWTNITNSAVAAGGRPRGSTVTALRDNPVAIAEGASGAPRVVGAAMYSTIAASTAVLKHCIGGSATVTIDTLAPVGPVTVTRSLYGESQITAIVACEVRVAFDHKTDFTGFVRVMRGDTVLTEFTSTTSYASETLDVTLAAGQTVWIFASATSTGGASGTTMIRNLRYLADVRSAIGM